MTVLVGSFARRGPGVFLHTSWAWTTATYKIWSNDHTVCTMPDCYRV